MATIRELLCYAISKRLMKPAPESRNATVESYLDWRDEHLSSSWASKFSDETVNGKDVLDFGSGAGDLSLFLARTRAPKRIIGTEIREEGVTLGKQRAAELGLSSEVIDFVENTIDGLPMDDDSFDTILAFDCMEHIMQPAPIMREWKRVLRPGGRVLIEWYAFRGPWGPHMEALIPIPWAHYIFGEKAMFRTCARIYDHPDFPHRHWDLDEDGNPLPNKWKQWSTFKEQGYVNELTIGQFKKLAREAGLWITRLEEHSFSSSPSRRLLSSLLMKIPFVKQFFTGYYIIELTKPKTKSPFSPAEPRPVATET